jgi:hypothetical protein
MKTTPFLRLASVISLLFAAGHTLGGRKAWTFTGETEVLQPMRTYQIQTMGVTRTYMDFYRGFGFTLSVFLVLQAVVLWQLATIARTNPAQVRPIILSVLVASIVNAILTWQFIFPVPAVFCVVVTAFLIAAFVAAGRDATSVAAR